MCQRLSTDGVRLVGAKQHALQLGYRGKLLSQVQAETETYTMAYQEGEVRWRGGSALSVASQAGCTAPKSLGRSRRSPLPARNEMNLDLIGCT